MAMADNIFCSSFSVLVLDHDDPENPTAVCFLDPLNPPVRFRRFPRAARSNKKPFLKSFSPAQLYFLVFLGLFFVFVAMIHLCGTTRVPNCYVKSMIVSNNGRDWNVTMSIENPNVRTEVSYNEGVVYVMHGTKELWRAHMRGFEQGSWGKNVKRWSHYSELLPRTSAGKNISEDMAHNGSAVFRVLMQSFVNVYPSASSGKKGHLLVDCDGLKVDFPSGVTDHGDGSEVDFPSGSMGGESRCRVELIQIGKARRRRRTLY